MRTTAQGTSIAAALLLLLVVPAKSDPKFTESYGSLFSARPFLAIPGDQRPKDVAPGQDPGATESTHRLFASPFVLNNDSATTYGFGLGYGSVHSPRHPWSVGFRYYNTDFDNAGSADTVDLDARLALWNPTDPNLPVVSLVGRYQDYDNLGERADVLLAADQRVSRDLIATLNLGWADHIDGVGSDFVSGLGVTWHPTRTPRFSLSADYVLDNDVDGEDFWTVSARWALDQTSSLRVGGGKHGTVFANYIAAWDLK